MGYRDELAAAEAKIQNLRDRIRAMELEAERTKRFDKSGETQSPVPGVRNKLLDWREKARAAEARIAELEARVRELEPLEATSGGALKEELASANARLARAERDLAGERRRAEPKSSLPSIVELNRTVDPLDEGKPASVVCPLCTLIGDRVEMRHRVFGFGRVDPGEAQVICPRCRYVHLYG